MVAFTLMQGVGMTIKEVINRIGYFRNKQNVSARELSLRIGKHDTYVNKLESLDFNLPVTILLEIIGALAISCEEFFSNNFTTYQLDKTVYDNFVLLSKANKDAIITIMQSMK